jgi:ferric-dicitrate binding protein FerR (iron transport regulator)
LNTGASIRYPVVFTGNERRVEVTGEAYFEVAHNAGKPFIVHVRYPSNGGAGGGQGREMDVQVVGTHFNINAYPDEAVIKTTLLQGAVNIKCNNYQTLLTPGQQAQVGSGAPQVINNVNVDAVIAWKNGRFIFDNADIDAVMRQLTRWYDIDVVYEGAKPTQRFIGPLDRNITLSKVAFILEYMTPGIHFRIEGRKLIVTSSSPNEPSGITKPHT